MRRLTKDKDGTVSLFVLLSQKHNRYHYAGEQQTYNYHEKQVEKEC